MYGVARMPDTVHRKKLLFGWLPQKRSAHGAKLCWWDKVHQYLKQCKISETSWYLEAQDHTKWRAICSAGLNQHVMAPLSANHLSMSVPPAITLFKGQTQCQ